MTHSGIWQLGQLKGLPNTNKNDGTYLCRTPRDIFSWAALLRRPVESLETRNRHSFSTHAARQLSILTVVRQVVALALVAVE